MNGWGYNTDQNTIKKHIHVMHYSRIGLLAPTRGNLKKRLNCNSCYSFILFYIYK